MSIKIVTDSTSDIPKSMAEKYGIEVVPLNIHFGDSVYKDGIDLTTEEFFDKLINGPHFPSTSQPSIGEFVETYERIAETGDEIISVHISSKLSGTYNSAEQASKQLQGKINVHLVDTQQVTITVGLSAISAAKVIKEGGSATEAVAASISTASRSNFYALFDTLEFLAKGGRIGKAQSMLGSLLKIRPLLMLEDGVVAPFSKARSKQSGLKKMEKTIRSLGEAEEIAVIYSTDSEEAKNIARNLSDLLPPNKEPLILKVGPVIGTHAGPGLVAVGLITKQ
jgi:DegV family protein with EDD domain